MLLLDNVLYNYIWNYITACNFWLKTEAFMFAFLTNICLSDWLEKVYFHYNFLEV